MEPEKDPWRHVIVVACAFILFFGASTLLSNGVFFVAFKDTDLYDDSVLAWLFSINTLIHSLAGPLCSLLLRVTSCRSVVVVAGLTTSIGFGLGTCTNDIRVLFVTYGFLIGLGRGLCFTATTVIIGYWFPKSSSLANGLMHVGVGVGMLVHPRLSQAFVDAYRVQGAQLLMSAFVFHTCVFGMLIRPSKFERQRHKIKHNAPASSERSCQQFLKSYTQILTNIPFVLFGIAACLYILSFHLVVTFMPDFFNHRGSTPQESAMAASIAGSGSLISRLLIGVFTNDKNVGTMILFIGNCGICGMLTLMLPFLVTSAGGRIFYSFSFGTYFTALFVVLGPTTLHKVGLEDLAHGFGLILMLSGVMNLIGPPVAVEIRKLSNSYYSTFALTGSLMLSCCVLGLLSECFAEPADKEEFKHSLSINVDRDDRNQAGPASKLLSKTDTDEIEDLGKHS